MFASPESPSTCDTTPPPICTVGGVCLSTLQTPISPLWPPNASAAFACPQTFDEAAEVKKWLYGLQDGQIFACRGRDYALNPILAALQEDDPEDPGSLNASLPPQFTEFDYGVGIKMDRAVFCFGNQRWKSMKLAALI